jgi:hypothetical protein
MKSLRGVLAVGQLLAAVSAFAAVPKVPTYTVVGFYFKNAKPSDSVLSQATAAVAKKVVGMVQVPEGQEADHRIEVLFEDDTFSVYVDAFPIVPKPVAHGGPYPTQQPYDYSWENAQSRCPSPCPVPVK